MHTDFFVKFTAALLLTASSLPVWAKSDANQVMGRFMLACESAAQSEAIHACALSKLVQAGDVPAQVVQACRDDLGPAPVAKPNQQVWLCAKVRQFGPKMDATEWQFEIYEDCINRSKREGHRYHRHVNDCMADAIVEQRRVSDTAVQACRSQPGIEKSHRLLNCLSAAMRAGH